MNTKIKSFFKRRPKPLAFLILLAINFAILHMFSVWQLDIVCVDPVWSYNWSPPEPRYADQYFQCWLWKTTVGEAYDTLLFLNFISFYGMVAVLIVMLIWALEES